MSMFANAILIDPNELRVAAGALRRAADESLEVRLRLPADAWGAPEWQAAALDQELGLLRLELDRLAADLINHANAMQRRADEVDGAEWRWWEIAYGQLHCGCVLPGGVIVAIPTMGTAASSAWGPGVAQTSPPPIMIGTAASSASGGGVVIGGGGLPGPTGWDQPWPQGPVIIAANGGLPTGNTSGGSAPTGNIATIGGGIVPGMGPGGSFDGDGMTLPTSPGSNITVITPPGWNGGPDPALDDAINRDFGPIMIPPNGGFVAELTNGGFSRPFVTAAGSALRTPTTAISP